MSTDMPACLLECRPVSEQTPVQVEGGGGLCTTALSAACPTMRFGSTAKVLAKCKLKYYRISECAPPIDVVMSRGYLSSAQLPHQCGRVLSSHVLFQAKHLKTVGFSMYIGHAGTPSVLTGRHHRGQPVEASMLSASGASASLSSRPGILGTQPTVGHTAEPCSHRWAFSCHIGCWCHCQHHCLAAVQLRFMGAHSLGFAKHADAVLPCRNCRI